MNQEDFDRWLAGEDAPTAAPAAPGSYLREKDLSQLVALTPEERAADRKTDQNPYVQDMLRREFAQAKDPKARQALAEEMRRQGVSGPDIPGVAGLDLGSRLDDYVQRRLDAKMGQGARPSRYREQWDGPAFAENRRRVDAQEASDSAPLTTSLKRGVHGLGHSAGLFVDNLLGDTDSAAQRIAEDRKFQIDTPAPSSSQKFIKDWSDLGDDDYSGMFGSVLRNPAGAFNQMLEQTPNSLPGMAFQVAAGIASRGLMALGPAGAAAGLGIQGLASFAGNALPEGGAFIQEAMAKAGVNPDDPQAVVAWLKANRDENLAGGLTKAGVISAVDAATGWMGMKLLAGPSVRFTQAERAFIQKAGVDPKNAEALAQMRKSVAYKDAMAPFAADLVKANEGFGMLKRAAGATGLDALGEGAGEYLGSYAATGDASAKDAILEGMMGVGQAGAHAAASYGIGKLGGPDQEMAALKHLAEFKGTKPQANSPLTNAAKAATSAAEKSPFADIDAAIKAKSDAYQSLVSAGGSGPEIVAQADALRSEIAALQDQRQQIGFDLMASDSVQDDPLAGVLDIVSQQLSDRSFIQKIRQTPGLGSDAVGRLMEAFGAAKNATLPLDLRKQAIGEIRQLGRAIQLAFNPAAESNLARQAMLDAEENGEYIGDDAIQRQYDQQAELQGLIDEERKAQAAAIRDNWMNAHIARATQGPTSGFGNMVEYERFLKDEAEHIGQLRAEAKVQNSQEKAKEAQQREAELLDVAQRVEAARQKETETKRAELLDSVLAENPQNPARAFDKALKRAGFRDTAFTEAERAKLARFVDLRSLPEDDGNIADAGSADFGIPEKAEKKPGGQFDRVASLLAGGWVPLNKHQLTGPRGETYQMSRAEQQYVRNRLKPKKSVSEQSGSALDQQQAAPQEVVNEPAPAAVESVAEEAPKVDADPVGAQGEAQQEEVAPFSVTRPKVRERYIRTPEGIEKTWAIHDVSYADLPGLEFFTRKESTGTFALVESRTGLGVTSNKASEADAVTGFMQFITERGPAYVAEVIGKQASIEVPAKAEPTAEQQEYSRQAEEIAGEYDAIGRKDFGDVIRASIRNIPPNARSVEFWRKQYKENVSKWETKAGAEAGTLEPVEPRLRSREDLFETLHEERAYDSVPFQVINAVLRKVNSLISELAGRGLHLDMIDSTLPADVQEIKKRESSLRGLFQRYAKQLNAIAKGYKRANPEAFAKAEAELSEEVGVDIKDLRTNGTAPEHEGSEGKPLDREAVYEPVATGPVTTNDGAVDESVVPLTMNTDDFREITDEWARLFADPGDERRSYDKIAGPYLTPEEAQARIDSWKAAAKAQFDNDETRSANAEKTVLSLFDYTGEWSKPWRDAGYNVIQFDIQHGQNVHDFSVEYFTENWDISEVYCILAACPCTDFASSGARWFAEKDADGRTEASKELVFQTLRTIEYFRPAIWALENPVGRIENLTGLPKSRVSFQPHHFGSPYTKRTMLWGQFNADMPTANVEPTEGSKMHSQFGGKSMATKNARSETPEGFAYAFFMANNYVDMPVERKLVAQYPEVSGAIKQALNAGVTEDRIHELMDDTYGNYEYDEARDVLVAEVAEVSGESVAAEQKAPEADTENVEFRHAGYLVYPVSINAGGVQMNWGVQTEDNRKLAEAGTRRVFGDTLHITKQAAIEQAERNKGERDRAAAHEAAAKAREEKDAAAKAALEADTYGGFLDGKGANVKALVRKALAKQWRFTGLGGEVLTARQFIERHAEGGTLEVGSFEEPKIKPMTRTAFNRATGREQAAHEEKMRKAGTKTVYTVNGVELGKIAHDYAQHLLKQGTEKAEPAEAEPKAVSEPPAQEVAAPEEAKPKALSEISVTLTAKDAKTGKVEQQTKPADVALKEIDERMEKARDLLSCVVS